MKIILKISQAPFGEFKLNAIEDSEDDYYSRPHARSSAWYSQADARFNKREMGFLEQVKDIQENPFPFNIFKEVYNHTYGDQFALNEIAPNMDWSIYTSWGYHIDHEKQIYAYSSCNGNFEGVYRQGGEYFYFYNGSRHWRNLQSYSDCEVVLYETTAPKDMAFWERQADYLIRKGPETTAEYIAKHGEDSDSAVQAKYHFIHLMGEEEFNKILAKVALQEKDPEQYILRKYRNKRLSVNQFDEKDNIAWSMLSDNVRSRILKYA